MIKFCKESVKSQWRTDEGPKQDKGGYEETVEVAVATSVNQNDDNVLRSDRKQQSSVKQLSFN